MVGLTRRSPHPHAAAPGARPARAAPQRAAASDRQPRRRTDRPAQHRSSLQAGHQCCRRRRRRTRGPPPRSYGGRRSRTPAPTADGTDASPAPDLAHLADHQQLTTRSNAYAERWVGTVRREVLDRMLIWDAGSLAMETARFRDIYNCIRPHQALDDRTPRQAYLDT